MPGVSNQLFRKFVLYILNRSLELTGQILLSGLVFTLWVYYTGNMLYSYTGIIIPENPSNVGALTLAKKCF